VDTKLLILISISVSIVTAVFTFIKPLSQPEAYHHFADSRRMLGVPNALDVLSNGAFCVVGLMGVFYVAGLLGTPGNRAAHISYLTFFAGLFLTGLGSGWYHMEPDNGRLVWDRLPMTIAFAGFFCSVLSELVSPSLGLRLLAPLLLVGILSVFYWIATERQGRGDLRPYTLVQFLPMILIPVIFYLYESPLQYSFYVGALISFYILAKIFESLDKLIYSMGSPVSGHTLKHLSAAAGSLCLLIMLEVRFV